MLKKIDWLVIRTFIPPFMTWMMVAIFVFNMQFLWRYIDDIVGKGLELTVIFELLFYQALGTIPKALIFATALASVMSFGNLAEHYELAAIKSTGISLLRTMAPLMVLVSGISVASFMFANYAIPVASLKFKTRLFEIRRQKPALNLQAGKFNTDFKDFVIYIDEKDQHSQRIHGVKIYDHTKGMGNVSQTNATEGELFYTEDKRYLVVRLKNGTRYDVMTPNAARPQSLPHMRVSFAEFTSLFDMHQFDFKEAGEDAFSNHYTLLSIRQLLAGLDSIQARVDKSVGDIQRSGDNLYFFRHPNVAVTQVYDSLAAERKRAPVNPRPYAPELPKAMPLDRPFGQIIEPARRTEMYQRAIGNTRTLINQAEQAIRTGEVQAQQYAAHENEIHQKFGNALACLLFLFVGAPMGAIIRKGGFGIPVLVAFVFFILYFILNLIGERLARSGDITCWVGAWLHTFVLFPMAIFLTYKALNDRPVLQTDRLKAGLGRLKFWKKSH